jgi:hypothetical protein
MDAATSSNKETGASKSRDDTNIEKAEADRGCLRLMAYIGLRQTHGEMEDRKTGMEQ